MDGFCRKKKFFFWLTLPNHKELLLNHEIMALTLLDSKKPSSKKFSSSCLYVPTQGCFQIPFAVNVFVNFIMKLLCHAAIIIFCSLVLEHLIVLYRNGHNI